MSAGALYFALKVLFFGTSEDFVRTTINITIITITNIDNPIIKAK